MNIDKLRQARNVNEICSVVSNIRKSFTQLTKSLSFTVSVSNEFVIDGRQGSGKAPVLPGMADPSFKPPALGRLSKHVQAITNMRDHLDDLEAALSMLQFSFQASSKQPAAVKAVTALIADVKKTITAAETTIGAVADSSMPDSLRVMGDAVAEHLVAELDADEYSDLVTQTLVAPVQGGFQYSTYINLKGLTDAKLYKYTNYYVIVSCIVDKEGRATHYVTSMPQFRAPSHFPIGRVVDTPKKAIFEVNLLLANNNVQIDFERRPIDLKRMQTAGIANIANVEDVDVEDNFLIVKCSRSVSTEARAAKVAEAVMLRLQGLYSSKASLRTRIEKESNFTVTFAVNKTNEAIFDAEKKIAAVDSVARSKVAPFVAVFTLRKGTTSQQVAKIAEKIQKVVGAGQARVTQPKIEETQRFTVRLALINRELKRSVTLDAVQKIAEDLGLSDEEQRSLLFAVQHRERR